MTVASTSNDEDLIENIVSVLNESGIEHIDDELRKLHPADIVHLLESILPESRELVWPHIDNACRGETLVELSLQECVFLKSYWSAASTASSGLSL